VKRLALTGLLVFSALAGAEEGPLIVVDPGHGGSQDGASGPNGKLEKDLALEIAGRVKTSLESSLHARVLLTREKDILLHLSERVAFANQKKPDLFVSIHANSMATQKQRERSEGIETFFLSASASDEDARSTADRENAETPKAAQVKTDDTLAYILADLQRSEAHADSSRLAYAVHQHLISATHANDRGVQQAPFYVLMGVDAPAILVEVGFISHPKEGPKLWDVKYQQKLATAITEGVGSFLDQIRSRDALRSP
jgi:N-acetylmuramoyl-L-alanine amidase